MPFSSFVFPRDEEDPLPTKESIQKSRLEKLKREVVSQSPSQKVLLYNSGSVSSLFFTKREDPVAKRHHKKNFKELVEKAALSLKKPDRLVEILLKDQERILRKDKALGRS